MKKFIIAAAAAAALAIPSAAMAAPSSTGVSTNANTKDAIGFCVSAGNRNLLNGENGSPVSTTGADRSSRAGQPGANADLIHGAYDWCANNQSSYAPPGA